MLLKPAGLQSETLSPKGKYRKEKNAFENLPQDFKSHAETDQTSPDQTLCWLPGLEGVLEYLMYRFF